MHEKILKYLRKALAFFTSNDRNLLILAFVNILGTIFGLYYYYPQIMQTPAMYWLFVMDSPISTALFAAALILIYLKKESNTLNLLAFFGLVKYGIWTAIVVVTYIQYYISSPLFESFIFLSHIGMAVEALVLVPRIKSEKSHVFLIFGWYFINDLLDYSISIHPILPSDTYVSLVALSNITLSALIYLAVTDNDAMKNLDFRLWKTG